MKRLSLNQKNQVFAYSAACVRIVALTVAIGVLLRVVLLFNVQTQVGFPFGGWLEIFLLGAVNDGLAAAVACIFLWMGILFWSDGKYAKPWGYVIFGCLVLVFCYVRFFHTILNEYGGGVSKIVAGLLAYKTLSFGIRLFVPKVRVAWRRASYYLLFFVYVAAILLNAVSEYYFWNEFGVRYNFIAVDYLIYTTEVIGNIMESYPIVPLMTVLALVAAGLTYFLARFAEGTFEKMSSFREKAVYTGMTVVVMALSCAVLNFNLRFQQTSNAYVNELQSNGLFRFYKAFVNNELEYSKFYQTLPKEDIGKWLDEVYGSRAEDGTHFVRDSLPEVRKNIVLITVESLSASFLGRYGNTDGITPHMDKLMEEGLTFDWLFATGNRTVRGLEAVTLCLPPCPGQSVIKRPDNANLFSTGKVLKEKGYKVQYFYGGNSYFDNMEAFFSGNGYEIIDRKAFRPDEITFANIWGVCDEDMYKKALAVFGENARSGQPFFGHIMTVSNHRPFTYPGGRIDIPENSKSRKGGVKYSDYALGQFMEEAAKQPWFANTVFLITADHCASSAGSTELPLDKYHIPALIYAPGYIAPGRVEKLVSQIDLIPTLFALLHFSYPSRFYGQNVLDADFRPRSFAATYQNLGYWEDEVLTVLSPVRRIEQFSIQWAGDGEECEMVPMDTRDDTLAHRAVAYYQSVSR